MLRSRTYFLILFIGLALVSCSCPKTISRDELRSDLLTAISLASETEPFTIQLQNGRVPPAFAKGHLDYLRKETSRTENELRRACADKGITGALDNGRAQLDSLATMLADLKDKSGDKESLSAGRQQAATIRMALEHAKDEL